MPVGGLAARRYHSIRILTAISSVLGEAQIPLMPGSTRCPAQQLFRFAQEDARDDQIYPRIQICTPERRPI